MTLSPLDVKGVGKYLERQKARMMRNEGNPEVTAP